MYSYILLAVGLGASSVYIYERVTTGQHWYLVIVGVIALIGWLQIFLSFPKQIEIDSEQIHLIMSYGKRISLNIEDVKFSELDKRTYLIGSTAEKKRGYYIQRWGIPLDLEDSLKEVSKRDKG